MATTKRKPEAEHNLDGYGAPLIPWTKIRERLERGFTQVPGSGGPSRHICWLATVHPDGRPHVMPLGVNYMDGTFTSVLGQTPVKRRTWHSTRSVSSLSPLKSLTLLWRAMRQK